MSNGVVVGLAASPRARSTGPDGERCRADDAVPTRRASAWHGGHCLQWPLHAPTLAGFSLAALGRESEAIASLEDEETRESVVAADFCRGIRFALQGRRDDARVIVQRYAMSATFTDPEGVFHIAQVAARVGDHDDAMAALSRSVEHGYCGLPALEVDPWLDPLRGRADFRRLRDRAELQRRAAVDTFIVAGGERLLGITVG